VSALPATEDLRGAAEPQAKMHAGEFDIDAGLVARLVAAQFPRLAGLPIREFESTGTVNAIYRLGPELYARLPRLRRMVSDLEHEWRWLPELAPRVPLQIPEPVALGEPDSCFPFPWAIYRWIDGLPYDDALVWDERRAAQDLAEFVLALRRIAVSAGSPKGGRKPLRDLDTATREAIESARGLIDGAAATAWKWSLEAPAWDGAPVWVHADLLRPNLLVHGGRLRAVIDFGSAGVGDPAADVIPAWSVFTAAGRATFRDVLDVDDGTWSRARGYALHQALLIIPYYKQTNPGFARLAQRTVREVLADTGC
jgi:aminoglycoside phosphotransferase (APT) family kinase protein